MTANCICRTHLIDQVDFETRVVNIPPKAITLEFHYRCNICIEVNDTGIGKVNAPIACLGIPAANSSNWCCAI